MSDFDTSDPVWFLRTGLAATGFAILFFWMGYSDPQMQPVANGFAGAQLFIILVCAVIYWVWPRSRLTNDGGST